MAFQGMCLLNATSQVPPEQPVDKTEWFMACLVVEGERQSLIYEDFEVWFKVALSSW